MAGMNPEMVSHFEELIEEHRQIMLEDGGPLDEQLAFLLVVVGVEAAWGLHGTDVLEQIDLVSEVTQGTSACSPLSILSLKAMVSVHVVFHDAPVHDICPVMCS